MKSLDEKEFLGYLSEAYHMGAYAFQKVNFGKKGFTKAMQEKERKFFNKILKEVGASKITDSEYEELFV